MIVYGEWRVLELEHELHALERSETVLLNEVVQEHAHVREERRPAKPAEITLRERAELGDGRAVDGVEASEAVRLPSTEAALDEVDLDREGDVVRKLASQRAGRDGQRRRGQTRCSGRTSECKS